LKNDSFFNVSRLLRMTLLEPEIMEAIVAGQQQPEGLTMASAMQPFPNDWAYQRKTWFN
jgi:hypothetical protein